MWLRSDFSLAVTGFLCASAPSIEEEYVRDAQARNREAKRHQALPYGNPPYGSDIKESETLDCDPFSEGELIQGFSNDASPYGSVKEDLWCWAESIKLLMRNDFAIAAPAGPSIEYLEDARLGTVLQHTLQGIYDDADEVIAAVQLAATTIGITVTGEDEIDIDEDWENVFEVCGTEIRFRAHQ